MRARDMNTTEAIMSSNPHRNPLIALDLALRAAGTAIALVDKVPGKFKSLEDQVIRSASSVAANSARCSHRFSKRKAQNAMRSGDLAR